jgi:hypothetical protein
MGLPVGVVTGIAMIGIHKDILDFPKLAEGMCNVRWLAHLCAGLIGGCMLTECSVGVD